MRTAQDIVIALNRRKWLMQLSINLFAIALFVFLTWIVLQRPEPLGSKPSSKILLTICTAALALPSVFVVIHLFVVRMEEPMWIRAGRLTDRTRVLRKAKDIPLDTITQIRIIYRARPFTGISREYRIDYKGVGEEFESNAHLSDYLVSRVDLEKIVGAITTATGFEC